MRNIWALNFIAHSCPEPHKTPKEIDAAYKQGGGLAFLVTLTEYHCVFKLQTSNTVTEPRVKRLTLSSFMGNPVLFSSDLDFNFNLEKNGAT